jgi:hypothetical protein
VLEGVENHSKPMLLTDGAESSKQARKAVVNCLNAFVAKRRGM